MIVAKETTNVKSSNKKEKQDYFSMKMPDWFAALDVEEKKSLIKKMTNESLNSRVLTRGELKSLMISSVK